MDFTNEQRIIDIKNEFFLDTLVDFNENNNNLLEELSDDEKKWINERVKSEINKKITANKTL